MNIKIQKHLEKIEISLDEALTITTCIGVLYENWIEEDITAVNYTDAEFSTQLKNATMKAAITKLRTMYKTHLKLSPGCYCYKSFIQLIQVMQWYCKKNNYHTIWN
jgi:hypothetical protein